jgi:hypothetical protein
MAIYGLLVVIQTYQSILGFLVVAKYGGAGLQVLEVIQSSLFFMMVQSVWFRMQSLREADKNITQNFVKEARKKYYLRYLRFALAYTAFLTVTAAAGYVV